MQFKGTKTALPDIAEALNVTACPLTGVSSRDGTDSLASLETHLTR
jgi:hypothetical protein